MKTRWRRRLKATARLCAPSARAADVLGEEPPAHGSPLLGMKNAILTPHVAWAPLQTRQRLLNIVVGNVAAFVKGAPTNVVNG